MVAVHAAQAYARIGLETGVAAASPQRLIVMLYDGALAALAEARAHIAAGRTAQKGRAIGKAISIVDEGLKAALDVSQGGDIARSLMQLYDYVSRRLLIANLRDDVALIDEANQLLTELRGAWATLAEREAAPAYA
ncbi:MAG TPA: flagellar export chaperone FliS [Casimicrobiaceae bacterium]|nr:flagellar export chaperone FliS [Casimicrobiaceae bacterium]